MNDYKDFEEDEPIWDFFDYIDEQEQFLEYFPCEKKLTEEEDECLYTLMMQTKKEMEKGSIKQNPTFIHKYTDNNGQSYLISKNWFVKVLKKSNFVNTKTDKNVVVQTPTDPNQIWFISPTIKDNGQIY
jgi:hypothetical protein